VSGLWEKIDGNLTKTQRGTVALGDCPDHRIGVRSPNPKNAFDWSIPPIDSVKNWVQVQIARGAPDIGGPLEVMRIDATGRHEWIPKKPDVCKDAP
jgi:hypothetical protein